MRLSPRGGPASPSILRAASLLAAANFAAIASGFLTGPILAHALGVDGRGLLAAVIVPLSLAAAISQFGIGEFATQQVAKGVPPRVAAATLIPLVAVAGLCAAVAVYAISGAISDGSEIVRNGLLIGSCAL